jgi:predicted PurR-regulated permease PerM
MILFGGDNPRAILVYGLVVLAILAFSYFVIIKPITDTTNDAVNNAFKQSDQIQRSVNNDLNQAFKNSQPNNGKAHKNAQPTPNQALQQAQRQLKQAQQQIQQATQQANK